MELIDVALKAARRLAPGVNGKSVPHGQVADVRPAWSVDIPARPTTVADEVSADVGGDWRVRSRAVYGTGIDGFDPKQGSRKGGEYGCNLSETPTGNKGDKGPVMLLSPRFTDWLASADVSVALTTYQAGRLIFIGRKGDGGVLGHERFIEQCQGLWTDGQTLWISGLYQLWRFENLLHHGETTQAGADRKFVPRESRVVGRIDTHDIGIGDFDGARRPIFVNTLYCCLATISETASFRPLWRPKFISALVPEDRCHLNGLAMDGARPAFVTAVSRSDVADGWRDRRQDGGVVIDVASGEIVADGFSMPHSPRLYDGRLWLLNSGAGEFGTVDPADGRFTPVCFCPGYARGLAFIGRYAVIGLSRPRHSQTFAGLALDGRLSEKDAVARCGLLVVDIDSGTAVEWLRFEHTIDELYDVAVLPRVRAAEAIGFKTDDIQREITVEQT